MALQLAKIDENMFTQHILPHIPKPKRGPKCRLSYYQRFTLILQRLNTGAQWRSMQFNINGLEVKYSWQSLYRYFKHWCQNEVFKKAFLAALAKSKSKSLSGLVSDGTQTRSHNGGACVAYQSRKQAKTTTQVFLTDTKGMVVGLGLPQSGNHHDCYQLVGQVKRMLRLLRDLGFEVRSALLHADKGFDTKAFRKYLWNTGLVPNIAYNKRNRRRAKPGPKRFFDFKASKVRFVIECTFGWFDSFKALLVRYEKRVDHWLELNYLAAFLINLNMNKP